LAVRAEVHRQLGGIPAIASQEDVAFVANARRAGYRLRHAPDVKVKVSARLHGRAKGGMADCLHGWVKAEQLGLPHLVEDPVLTLHRLTQLSPCAVFLRSEHCDDGLVNAGAIVGVKTPEVDVETAIERLEEMIAMSGTRVA
jgi:hypothetical protein